jgi:hypothetical protein
MTLTNLGHLALAPVRDGCCAGAAGITKTALSLLLFFCFSRTRGPGFFALSNAAQAQRF